VYSGDVWCIVVGDNGACLVRSYTCTAVGQSSESRASGAR
jgi:hypothetical protein